MARRRSEDDEDGGCESGPIPASIHAWAREPWPGKLQAVLDALEIDALDEGSRLYLQRQLHIGSLFNVDRSGHVVLTLRCITESEGNSGALAELPIRAVSGAIGPYADRGLALIEAFDSIPLLGILEQMRALDFFYAKEAQGALERILTHKLRRMLSPPQPEATPKPDLRALNKAARLKLVEQRVELGRQLLELREANPSNAAFSRAVRKQFGDIYETNFVCKLQRVAKRYGDRPEMFVAGWQALVQLSSPLTKPELRRKAEARIAAGGRVTGAGIARARMGLGL
ncbi:hypothetical protein [Bradyrhizobium sp. CCBAU 53415]|uniref:hypothetical protein n=1 Tax=Bradyrhizobium sp. CCBAU 53415 TaxID=1325119 RepID=UPI0023051670|nr:hypothetical protein [Bradyrhizobium sp. CCBAU 53415]MDA9465343.1 hypothetical protein [Bradyrhizobium sp. CCBAU 53415]